MKNRIMVFIVSVLALPFVFCVGDVFASDTATLNAKAIFTGVYNCYMNNAYGNDWLTSDGMNGFTVNRLDTEAVKLPYKLTDADDNNVDCREVMEGFADWTSNNNRLMLGLLGDVSSGANGGERLSAMNYTNRAKLFAGEGLDGQGGLGYKAETISESMDETKTIKLNVTPLDSCADSNLYWIKNKTDYWTFPDTPELQKIDGNNISIPVGINDDKYTFIDGGENATAPSSQKTETWYYSICNKTFSVVSGSTSYTINTSLDINYSADSQFWISSGNASDSDYSSTEEKSGIKYTVTVSDEAAVSSENVKDYNLGPYSNQAALNAQMMVRNLGKNNKIGYNIDAYSLNDLKYSDQEVYDLYTYYLTNEKIYNVPIICDDQDGYDNYANTGVLVNFAKGKECRALTESTKARKDSDLGNVYGVDDDNIFQVKVNLAEIIRKLGTLDLENLDTEGAGTLTITDAEEGAAENICEASGAAKSLGWIVCPVLEWMSDAATQIYEEYVEPSLRIEPQLFTVQDNSNRSATQQAWETFRNFANIVFIAFFLLIIFSQLTGVGIDNYGIKKTLPKLIVVAVLVNLSFLICQICVDLSNIVGNGLQAMFENMAEGFGSISISNLEGATDSVPATGGAISSVLILGGIMGLVGLAFSPAMIVTLLLAALGVVVAILFLFVLLAARQAAIVVLVLLSPLAFICYILPNMKKMFEKWLKLWEGMLLLYPICGLLVGGGNYVAKLLLATGMASQGLFGAFTAMIVGVAPIFFIPALLKGAFSAMGKLGGTLATMGSRASTATKKYTRSTGGAIAKGVSSTDTYRSIRNAIGRHSLTKRGRARAVTDTGALLAERAKRNRLADRSGMERRFQSIAAAEDARAYDEATSQELSLMMSAGKNGGINYRDPHTGKMVRLSYTLENAEKRMSQLEEEAREGELNLEQRNEMAALARGMVNMKGGAGKLSRIVRNSQSLDGLSANGNFMQAIAEIYSRDSAVQSKMNEKDMGASIYTEQFMPGGIGDSGNLTTNFSDFKNYVDSSGKNIYQDGMNNRVKSHAAGLNQSGDAFNEYLDRLNNSANPAASYQEILDDDSLMNSLDAADRDKVREAAAKKGVTGKTAQFVGEAMYDNISGGSAQKLMEYSDGTLRDAAGNRYDRADWKKTVARVVGEATYQDATGRKLNLMQMDDGTLQDEFGKEYSRTKWTKV